ncbi:MAG: class I SAM-dependent methyltransferase family protein, partial [Planctomycetota bacterium]
SDGLEFEVYSALDRVRQHIANPFKNYLVPRSTWRWIFRKSGSELLAESQRRPGGWKAMEIIYANNPPKNFIDEMAVSQSPYSVEIRNRKTLVTDRLAKLVRHYAESAEDLLMVSVGGGPGRYMLEGMAANPEVQSRGVVIDFDDEAFSYGHDLQQQMELDGRVEYIKGDARDIARHVNHAPEIVLIVGLFDYLTDPEARQLIEVMFKNVKPGGSVLATSLSDPWHNAPFLKRAFGWDLNFRTGQYLAGMFGEAGFDIIETTETPMHIYTVVTARKDATAS